MNPIIQVYTKRIKDIPKEKEKEKEKEKKMESFRGLYLKKRSRLEDKILGNNHVDYITTVGHLWKVHHYDTAPPTSPCKNIQ